MSHELLKQQNLSFIPYNWIHYSPINKLGISNSSYCIKHMNYKEIQLNQTEMQKIQQIRQSGDKKFMIDLVLNHLSPDSEDFNDIDTFYNQINSNWLEVPIVFDHLLYVSDYYLNKDIQQNQKIYTDDIIVQKAEQMVKYVLSFIFTYQNWNKQQTMKVNILKDKQNQIIANILGNVRYMTQQMEKGKYQQFFMKYFQPIIYKDTLKQCYQKQQDLLQQQLQKYNNLQEYIENNQDIVEEIINGNVLYGACNGFVIGEARNFISQEYDDYLLRNVISWGDCTKINYENHQIKQKAIDFAVFIAQNFDGIRIDNAHSTDSLLLRQVIKQSRQVNKNLLVMFEVFTGTQDGDNIFCQNNYGDCIVRESNNCYDCDQYCYLLRYSMYVGNNILADYQQIVDKYRINDIYKFTPVVLYDYTHDNNLPGHNESSQQIGNQLATSTLCQCIDGIAYGTTFGVDNFITNKIKVTCDKQIQVQDFSNNMVKYKQTLQDIRNQLINYHQIYAQNYGSFFTVERMNNDFQSYIFIIQPAFKYYKQEQQISDIKIQGYDINIICQYQYDQKTNDIQDTQLIQDLQTNNMETLIKLKLQQSSIIILQVKRDNINCLVQEILSENYQQKLEKILDSINLYQLKQFIAVDKNEDRIERLLYDYNFGNIPSTFNGFFAYNNILQKSNIGDQIADNLRQGDWFIDYFINRQMQAGYDIQPLNKMLTQIKNNSQLSYKPLLIAILFQQTQMVINNMINQRFLKINQNIYFNNTILNVYSNSVMSSLILFDFSKENSVVDINKWQTNSFQEYIFNLQQSNDGLSNSSSKTNISIQSKSNIYRRHNMNLLFKEQKEELQHPQQATQISIAAGYPHFMNGMFRTWGRDVMLSITGLLTVHKQMKFAREASASILVSSASLVRNGLLPNLYDQGRKPRYNCRDAVWYWIAALFQYIQTYNDYNILNVKVKRIFLFDDEKYYIFNQNLLQYVYTQEALKIINDKQIKQEQSLIDIIEEILYKHYQGIDFWEWTDVNDNNMKQEGRYVQVYVDKNTGLIYGGSQYNCHTWMDKMGSNQQFGNKGVPATPRNGADIEINLCAYYVFQQLQLYFQKVQQVDNLQFQQFIINWFQLLHNNIRLFEQTIQYNNENIQILQDCIYKNENKIEFRPNYLIGLSYQDTDMIFKYRIEILNAFKYLMNKKSIGLKTLAPFDKKYNSWYDNNNKESYQTADGFSYHNGPEWGHCLSRGLICLKKLIVYLQKNKHHFNILQSAQQFYKQCIRNLQYYYSLHNNSNGDIIGYPELTNDNAQICYDSCITQAWALGALIESIVYDQNQ